MSNPLVAAPVSSTTAVSGVPLLEDAQDVKSSIESGDWASAALGVAGTAMDALEVISDPFGAIISAGVGWLMEHVGPLKQALDALAGNPDKITSYSQTWQNVSQELSSVGQELLDQVKADLQSWQGDAADAYRQRAEDVSTLVAAAGEASGGAANGVQTAGEVVAAVRSLVRDTIAEVVAHLVSWALQVVFTCGIGLAWVVPQVAAKVATTATKISGLVQKLVKALKTLGTLLRKAHGVFDEVGAALKKIKAGKAGKADAPHIDKPPKTPGGQRPRSGPGDSPGSGHGDDSTTSSRSLDDDLRNPEQEWKDKYDGDGRTHTSPGAPGQNPHGGGTISQHTHDHVNLGNLKPARPNPNPRRARPATFSGGHVATGDLPPGTAPTATLGNGINGGTPVFGPPKQNGVYNIHAPQTLDGSGNPVTKLTGAGRPGQSTMFPPGTHTGLTQNVAGQAWNGGHPSGGFTPTGNQTTAHGHPGSYTWQGQGQIPYTPIYDKPGGVPGPDHGAPPPAGENPYAGQRIDVNGFANPQYQPGDPIPSAGAQPGYFDPHDPTQNPAPDKLDVNPATYFPQ
ncbi:WXG100-like domain-containing protein [Amycolatopsis jiangsuensis]|uniref:Uncharacterized protein YukE n=1 Tax=Amycolatopsis jiangsuensis TaxID=1181879 RepID=A0A840IWL1_9PSEU|nr:WXG100 family type VII secretion target [Amycolatopsis jiangsuensis]MBB4686986.1 uncharacterized protein YukE [Amycolatopsis jiangsuensis]